MKIHILFNFQDGPFGGGNQFLKALRECFTEQGSYTENPDKADVVLFSSNPSNILLLLLSEIRRIKKTYPDKIIVNRIDGPVFLIRDRNLEVDKAFFQFNDSFADGTVFQSAWSKYENNLLGMKPNSFEIVVMNAPNPVIFNPNGKIPFSKDRKIRLIATSWSSNWKKGFKVYQWLDEHLSFEKYEMTFIGNSPCQFKNIRHISPLPSLELAQKLKENDIFITASQKDPCSNSLIEALHCGLPAIALNDGGHPEITGKGGAVFNQPEEIPAILDRIVQNYTEYQAQIKLPSMEEIGKAYYDFMCSIYDAVQKKEYTPKRLDWKGYAYIKAMLWKWRIGDRLRNFLEKGKISWVK